MATVVSSQVRLNAIDKFKDDRIAGHLNGFGSHTLSILSSIAPILAHSATGAPPKHFSVGHHDRRPEPQPDRERSTLAHSVRSLAGPTVRRPAYPRPADVFETTLFPSSDDTNIHFYRLRIEGYRVFFGSELGNFARRARDQKLVSSVSHAANGAGRAETVLCQ
jgi:hypothetical protein